MFYTRNEKLEVMLNCSIDHFVVLPNLILPYTTDMHVQIMGLEVVKM